MAVACLAVALVTLYALAGFVGVPRLVKSRVIDSFARNYSRTVSIGELRFNPFTFEFEAHDFSLPDADGSRMLGFERFYADFELASLWHRAWTFGEIDVDAPYLRLVRRADRIINLLDLVRPETAPAAANAAVTGTPALRIADLRVAGGTIDVEERAREKPFAMKLAPVTFRLTDFRTARGGNSFAFTAGSDRAGHLALEGGFGVEPLGSKGSLTLTGLQATAISDYLGDLLPVTLRGGVIDLGFTYDLSLSGDPFGFVLDMPSLTMRNLVTIGRGQDVPWQIPAVDLRDTHIDLAARSVVVSSVEVRGLSAPAWRDRSGFNAPGMLPRERPAPSTVTTVAKPGDEQRGWSVAVPLITVLDARLPFEDRTPQRPAAFELALSSLTVEGLKLPAGEPLTFEAAAASGAGGEISASGSVRLRPLAAAVDVQVSSLNLTPLQPYLEGRTDLLLESGAISTQGRLELSSTDELELSCDGDLQITGLHTRDRPLKEDFVKWKSLEVSGIRYSSRPGKLSVSAVVAREPYLRLILAESGVTNIESVLDPAAAAAKAAAIESERAAEGRSRSRGKDTGEPPLDAPAAAAVQREDAPATPSLAISIGNTRIVGGNINFADYTIRPSFRISMEHLNGTIGSSSSAPGARSELILDGEVDRYAPVHVAGRLNLLAPKAYLDVSGYFRNIDLTSFNPYSTKFIGYQIAKGKLSIETKYKVEDSRLEALHNVKLDQLEFGEKIESPDAIGLPVKLAVALLKDSQGVIDLELPVAGSLDDPRFRLGPIIWKVFLGLLTKVVTAPFALLGNLFGGGEDLSYVDFPAGSAELGVAATDKITSLRAALAQRPALKLEIPWTAFTALDGPALERSRWEAAVDGAGAGAAGDWKTNREHYLRRLEALYQQIEGRKPDLQKPPRPAPGEPKPDPVEFGIGQLEPQLKAGFAVGSEQIDALAEARAVAVLDTLLGEDGIAAERVFMSRGGAPAAAGESVRMTLSLK
jgi:hypothetical protein